MGDDAGAGRIGFGEAARRYGVSRRTLYRWTSLALLDAEPDPADGRRSLLRIDQLEQVLRLMGHPGAPARPSQAGQFDPVVDDAAALVETYALYVAHAAGRVASAPGDHGADQPGWLRESLRHLAAVATGERQEPRAAVEDAISSILKLLLWPVAAADFLVPLSFWGTDLGKLLSAARGRVYAADELVDPDEAARLLGLSRPTVLRRIEDRTLTVGHPAGGGPMVVRRDVETLAAARAAGEGLPG